MGLRGLRRGEREGEKELLPGTLYVFTHTLSLSSLSTALPLRAPDPGLLSRHRNLHLRRRGRALISRFHNTKLKVCLRTFRLLPSSPTTTSFLLPFLFLFGAVASPGANSVGFHILFACADVFVKCCRSARPGSP